MSDYEDDAEAYNEHMEKIAEEYGPKALRLLERIRQDLHDNGLTVTQPIDMSADDYRYNMTATLDGHVCEDDAVDIEVEFPEQRLYEGDSAPWGLNFGIDITFVDGRIIGGLTPYNFTEECWVDSTDAEAVAARWAILDQADVSEIAPLIKAEIERRRADA